MKTTAFLLMKKAIALAIVGFLLAPIFFETTPTLAHPDTSSTIWQEYPSVDPTFSILGDGTIRYNTTYGIYQMDKSYKYLMSFTDRSNTQLISNSMFWLNTTATIDPAKIAKEVDWTASNERFTVAYKPQYKGGELTKDTIIGIFAVTYLFYNVYECNSQLGGCRICRIF